MLVRGQKKNISPPPIEAGLEEKESQGIESHD